MGSALAQRGIPLASNQVEYSLLHRRPQTNEVLDAAVSSASPSSPTSRALTGRYTPTNGPRGLRRLVKPFRGRGLAALEPITALLREIGERYGKTPAQVALRWLIENDTVLPIPGAKNREQATENVPALTFHLTQNEIDALDTATRALRLTPGTSRRTHIGIGGRRVVLGARAGGVLTDCRKCSGCISSGS